MKLRVEQTPDAYVITIPNVDVWSDAFLHMTVKLLERYDPADERAEQHRKIMALSGFSGAVSVTGANQHGNTPRGTE
jgi:hypothetical protein